MKIANAICEINRSIKHYDSRKGYLRRIFGDSKSITKLKAFARHLRDNHYSRIDNPPYSLSLSPDDEMAFLNILGSGLNNRRLTGDITRTLFAAFNKKLINIVKILDEYNVPFPNLINLLQHKKSLDKIFSRLQAKLLLSNDTISKIMLHKEHSESLAFLIERTPTLTKEQLNMLIEADWFHNLDIQNFLFANRGIKEERILQFIQLNDANTIVAGLNLNPNALPCVRVIGPGKSKPIDWALHEKTPSRLNLCNFFKGSPTVSNETQHLLQWINRPLR